MALQRWTKQAQSQTPTFYGEISSSNYSYIFPTMGQGCVALVSVSVPNSPPGAFWNVFVGGQLVGSIFGSQPCGPLFLAGGDVLTMTSSPNTFFIQSPGGAVAIGVVGNQGEITPPGTLNGGGIPVGVNVVAVSPIIPSTTATSTTIQLSQNARGVLVVSDQPPLEPPPPVGPNFMPVNLAALALQYGGHEVGIDGIWWYPVTAGSIFQVVFATIPVSWIVYEVDYDFDFTETTRGLGVYTIQVPNPAPGADWSYTLPAPARLVEVTATLAASAAAATRFPRFYFTNTGLVTANTPMTPAGVTASQDYVASGWPGAALVAGAASASLFYGSYPIPDMLLAGGTINSATNNIQAADQWGGVVLTLSPI